MLEEGMQEILTTVFGNQGVGDLVSQFLNILGDEVGHFPILGMAPALLHDIEFRCISR